MTYDPRTGVTTERDRQVIVTPQGSSGGMVVAAVLIVLAVAFAIWFFGFSGDGTTTVIDNDNPVVTTAPVETNVPAETTAPVDTAPATTVAP